jgi:hypothetical protein
MSFRNLEERFNARVNDLYRGYNRKFEDGRPSDGINDDPLLTRRPGDSQLGLKQEGRSVPIVSSARDVKRLTLFTLSQRGLLFLAKQQLLQTGNIFQSTRFINPLFVIGNAIPFLHIRRSFRGTIDDTSVGTLKRIGQIQQETYTNLTGGGLTLTGLLSKIPVIGKTLSAASSGRSVGDGIYEYKYARPELKENDYFVYKMYLGRKSDNNTILSTIGKFSNFLKRFGIGRGVGSTSPSVLPSPLVGPLNYYGAVNTDGTYKTYLLETDGKKESFYASRDKTDYSNFLLASYRLTESGEPIRSGLLIEFTNELGTKTQYETDSIIKEYIDKQTETSYGVNETGTQVLGSDYKRTNLNGITDSLSENVRSNLINNSVESLEEQYNSTLEIKSALDENTEVSYGVSETGAPVLGSDYGRTRLNGAWSTNNQEPEDNTRTDLLNNSSETIRDKYDTSDRRLDVLDEIQNYQLQVDTEFQEESSGLIERQPFIKYFTPDDTQVILSREATNAAQLGRAAGNRKIKYLKDPLNEPYEGVNVLDRYRNLRTLDGTGREKEDDIITVSFAMGNNNHVQFRAFIRDLDQSMSPEYKPYQYIGRIEKFIYYLSVERTVNFKLDILAFSKDELDIVWNRINYMTSLVFPHSVNRGILQPNILRMTIGNVYVDQPAYITNMSVNFNEITESWDIDREVPIGATLSLSMNLIEKNTKTANEAFYGINERRIPEGEDEPPLGFTPAPDVPESQLPPPQAPTQTQPTTQPIRNFSLTDQGNPDNFGV